MCSVNSNRLAITPLGSMDIRVLGQSGVAEAAIYCAASTGGRRQNLRKVHGIRTGIHQATLRITWIGNVQSHSNLSGRRLHIGGTFYGKYSQRVFSSNFLNVSFVVLRVVAGSHCQQLPSARSTAVMLSVFLCAPFFSCWCALMLVVVVVEHSSCFPFCAGFVGRA